MGYIIPSYRLLFGRKEVNMKTKSLICGFVKDENNLQLTKVFSDNTRLKELYIDIYSSNPLVNILHPMLLLRTFEKNANISNDGTNLIIKQNDKCETHVLNILFNSINESYFKKNFENSFDFILKCQNIYYKISIFN